MNGLWDQLLTSKDCLQKTQIPLTPFLKDFKLIETESDRYGASFKEILSKDIDKAQ